MEKKKPSILGVFFLGVVVFIGLVTLFDSDWGIDKKEDEPKRYYYSSYYDGSETSGGSGGTSTEEATASAKAFFDEIDAIEARGERPLDATCEEPNADLGYHVLYVRSKILLDESGTGLVFPDGAHAVGFKSANISTYNRLVEGKAYRCHLVCDEYEAMDATTCDQNSTALPPTKEEVEKKNAEIEKKNTEKLEKEHAKWFAEFKAEQKALEERPQRLLKVTCEGSKEMDLGYQTLYVWRKDSIDGMGGFVWPNNTQRVEVDDPATLKRLVEGKAYECHIRCSGDEKRFVHKIEVLDCKRGSIGIPPEEEITEDSPYTQWLFEHRRDEAREEK